MKPRLFIQRNDALTLIEVLAVIATLLIVVAIALPIIAISKRKSNRLGCTANLQQIGLAYRMWEGDNDDKYPMEISVTNGGAMESIVTGNVAACFQVMSNELSTPIILVCPKDENKIPGTNFTTDFNNSKISYFVSVDVTNEINSQRLLGGDDNFQNEGVAVKSGLLQLSTNTSITWTSVRHKYGGNILFADGSVQQVSTRGLQNALEQTSLVTNRLAIP